jgi:chorismate dehydratase
VVTTLTSPREHGSSPEGKESAALRLGVVSYLNAEPLVYGLAGERRFRLERNLPARVAEMLHRGEHDLGMIPSIEYAFGDYAIVPGIAIGSRGPVRSVNLYHRRPLAEARRVALDTSSRTSVALAKVLLHETLGGHPEYLDMPPSVPQMLEAADAALVIGDPALYFEGELPRLDLGEEWRGRTGLPFVYAFWAGRRGAITPRDVARLQQALREGLQSLDEIAASYDGHGSGHGRENASYLRSNIVYSLGEEEQRGLAEFYRRAHALGLIPRLPELRFHVQA